MNYDEALAIAIAYPDQDDYNGELFNLICEAHYIVEIYAHNVLREYLGKTAGDYNL